MQVVRTVLSSLLVLSLAACAHAPEARQDQPDREQADIAGIGPRPKVFGRHAWDEAQKRAAARMAQSSSTPGPAVPATPAAPAASAPPSPPPAPAVVAAVEAPPPAPAAQPAPPVAAITPAPAAPPEAPRVAAAPAPATPVPARTEKPQKAKPAKPAQLADAPAKKGPGLWQRITAPPPAAPVIAGGYGPASDKTAVEAAAAFAVHESPGYVLKGVYSAKVQVVAGTNYSLCLWVRRPTLEPNPLHRRMVAATVFQGLDGHRELTAWKEVGTCHAGTPAE